MKSDLIYTKKIKTGRCVIVLYWREQPEFKLIKIDLFDDAKMGSEKGTIPDTCYKKHKTIKEIEDSIVDYFKERKPLKFDLHNFDFSGCSESSKKILAVLGGIPFGRVTTYKKLAELSGFPGACRAVGSVMAKNPFPLLLPCHRVIGTNLCIGKFGPGSELKRFLLCHEISENVFDECTLRDKKFLILKY